MISLYHWKRWFLWSIKNWFIYFKIAWWNGETPSLHRILHRIASHGMPWSPKISKNVLQAPEVVIALLGHGAMMAKFCHLEASPQNNEACGWMARADGCGWRSKKWSSLAVYLLGVSETLLVFMSLQPSYETWKKWKHSFHHAQKRKKGLTKFDRFWRSSLSSKQPNLGAQCCGSCKGGTEWHWWVPKFAGVVSHSSWDCPTKIPLQRLVSDFKLSFCQCMKQHAEPRIMPIKTGRLRWIEWNLAIFSSHGCSEAPGVQQSWRLRHRSWAIWARGMWLAGSFGDTRWTENPTPNGYLKMEHLKTEFRSSWWFRNWFQFFFGVKSDWAQVDSCRVGFNVPEFLDLARWPRKSRLQTVRLGTFLNCAGLHVYRERSCIPCILYLYCINPQCMTLWMHVCGTYVYVCF